MIVVDEAHHTLSDGYQRVLTYFDEARVLPADLPEDWQDSLIVAPEGTDVGLTEQHGYN